jgi:hypothetical protein
MLALVAMALAIVSIVWCATADGAEISDEKQALLEQQGMRVVDTNPVEQEKVPGRCTFGGRVKSIGSRIEGYGGIMVRGRLRWSGCAHGGEIHKVRCTYYHDSPGRYWFNVYGPAITRHGAGTCRSLIEWVFRPPNTRESYWQLQINMTADANGSQIWFPVKRRVWR